MTFIEKYVTVAGAGAHDGTSEANAWTFAEMISAAPAAGTRVNVKAGSYSEGATTLPANGTASAPVVLRGYNSTIGDLDNQGRGSDGMLNTANMPDITITASWTPSTFCFLQNLDITGAVNAYLILSTSVDNVGLVNCRMVNTADNASAGVIRIDDMGMFTNCDFICTGNSHGNMVDGDTTLIFRGCVLSAACDGVSIITCNNGQFDSCVFLGSGSTSIAVVIQNAIANNSSRFARCTFYNCGTAIQTPNLAPAGSLSVCDCHVTDCAKFIDNLYATTADLAIIECNNRLRDVTTPRTGVLSIVLAGEVTQDDGNYTTDYVSATNLRLLSTAAGANAGMMPYTDIGAYRHADPPGGGGRRSRARLHGV